MNCYWRICCDSAGGGYDAEILLRNCNSETRSLAISQFEGIKDYMYPQQLFRNVHICVCFRCWKDNGFNTTDDSELESGPGSTA
jgi:hypothetical protein